MSDDGGRQPLYARALRLRYLRPGGALCFLFFEGAAILGVLLSLAELTPWWSVAVLPATVAAMVKVNDMVAGALGHRASGGPVAVPMGGVGPAHTGALAHGVGGGPAAVPMGDAGPAHTEVPRRARPAAPEAPAPADPRRGSELPRP
jgi:hypothetical protein